MTTPAQLDIQAVLIGGSAGALEVVSHILPALPRDFAPSIVIVIHLPPHRPSALAEALRPTCQLSLREPQDKEPLAPSTVYLAPPDYHLLIDPGPLFSLSMDEPVNYSRPSIDVLFESAADVLGPRCAGIIVSGANPDGAQGLRAVAQAGGHAVAQSPDDAAHRMMPQSALALCPDAFVLSAKEIAQWLLQISGMPNLGKRRTP